MIGDCNLIRRPEDRNKEGADVQEMFLFNEAISVLDLVEIPLLGRHYTWTNKQAEPLLERLDWFFSSPSWTLNYPNTVAKSLIMETFDHRPCSIEISTAIPATKIFRCENYWLQHENFKNIVQPAWSTPTHLQDHAKRLTSKFKNLRSVLRVWSSNLSSLSKLIKQVKSLIYFMETMELLRDLTIQEWNFRNILYDKLASLLMMRKVYWKQRSKVTWVREEDAGTKLFPAHATVRHRRNTISSLLNDSNLHVSDIIKKQDSSRSLLNRDWELQNLWEWLSTWMTCLPLTLT